jgi:hypothetical protein
MEGKRPTESAILQAFHRGDGLWFTERQIQRMLEETKIRMPLERLIAIAEQLAKKQYLDIIYTHAPGESTSGFAAKLSLKGQQRLRRTS